MSSDLPPYLEFIPQCLVILCHDHRRCFTRRGIVAHLEQDHNTSSEASDRVHKAACELNVVKGKPNARPSASIIAPIPGLEIFAGFQCAYDDTCGWLTRDKSIFRQHLGAEHGLYGSDREDSSGAFKNVLMQNLFGNPKHPIYIIVSPRDPNLCEASLQSRAKDRIRDEDSADQPRAAIGLGDEAVFDNTATVIPRNPRTDTTNASLPCDSLHPQREASSISQNQSDQAPGERPKQRPHNSSPSTPPAKSTTDSMEEASLLESTPACSPSFAQMVFRTEQKDTERIHLCLASDLVVVDPGILDPSPLDADFEEYRKILLKERIINSNSELYYVHARNGKVQLTSQVTFRAAIICQLAHKAEHITFISDSRTRTQLPSVAQISSEALNPLSQDSGPEFANTIFYAERQGSENTHLCLASDLSLPGSDKMNISPRLVNFGIYCELLKEEDVLNQDFQLRFIDAKGKRIPIKNQMMFHAAVMYQVTQKVDMITFSSESIKSPVPSSTGVTVSGQASNFDRGRQVSTAQVNSSMNPKTLAMNEMPNKVPNQPFAKSNFLEADQPQSQKISLESGLCFAKLPTSPHTTSPKANLFDRALAGLTPQNRISSPDTFLQEAVAHVGQTESYSLSPANPRKRARDSDGINPEIRSPRLDMAQVQPGSRPFSMIPIAASVVDGLLKIKYYQPPRGLSFWETNHSQTRRASETFEKFSNVERLIGKPHLPSPGPFSESNHVMSNTHSHPSSLAVASEEEVFHPIVKQEEPEHNESSTSNNFEAWYENCGKLLAQPDHPRTYF